MFPVVIRYFMPMEGVKCKLLELSSVKGETHEIIVEMLRECLQKHDIAKKMIAFCGDNTNTNFGGVKRAGLRNVFYKLKQIYPHLIGVGCAAHIVHNSMQHACDGMPFDVELIVVKIYSHFYIFTVRVTQLMNFCESVDVQYKNLLGYSKTRFLALLSCVESILRVYDGLKAYFLNTEKSPKVLKDFFADPYSKMWLMFTQDQVVVQNSSI